MMTINKQQFECTGELDLDENVTAAITVLITVGRPELGVWGHPPSEIEDLELMAIESAWWNSQVKNTGPQAMRRERVYFNLAGRGGDASDQCKTIVKAVECYIADYGFAEFVDWITWEEPSAPERMA